MPSDLETLHQRHNNAVAAHRQQIAALKAQLHQYHPPSWPQPRKLAPRPPTHNSNSNSNNNALLPKDYGSPWGFVDFTQTTQLSHPLTSPVDFHDFWNQLCALYVHHLNNDNSNNHDQSYDASLVTSWIVKNSEINVPEAALNRATSLHETGIILMDSLIDHECKDSLLLNPVADIWNYFMLNLRPIKNLTQLLHQFNWLYNNYQFLSLNGSSTPSTLIWMVLCKWRNYKPLDNYLFPLWNENLAANNRTWPDFESFLNTVNRFIRVQISTEILKSYSVRPRQSESLSLSLSSSSSLSPVPQIEVPLQAEVPRRTEKVSQIKPPSESTQSSDNKVKPQEINKTGLNLLPEFSDFENIHHDDTDESWNNMDDLEDQYDLLREFDCPISPPQSPIIETPLPDQTSVDQHSSKEPSAVEFSQTKPSQIEPSQMGKTTIPAGNIQVQTETETETEMPYMGHHDTATIKYKSPFYKLPYLTGPAGTANSYRKKALRLQQWQARCASDSNNSDV